MKYHQAKDGEWLKPEMNGEYRMRCCDCGLVHKIDFGIINNQVVYRAWRDNRATAASRRKGKFNGKHG